MVVCFEMTIFASCCVWLDEVLLARAKELEVEMAEVQMENESLNNQVRFAVFAR